MQKTINGIAATLRFTKDSAPNFYDLASPICWCLRQADIAIQYQDMGITGDSMVFVTDHGRIAIERSRSTDRNVEIVVQVEADEACDVLVARQVCYQLIRRLCHRAKITSIVWQPSLQVLRPAQFTWGVLQDMPRRLNEATQRHMMPHYGAALH